MEGRGRNGKGREGDKKEMKGWKGRGKDLPDQCQTASYAPDAVTLQVVNRWRTCEFRPTDQTSPRCMSCRHCCSLAQMLNADPSCNTSLQEFCAGACKYYNLLDLTNMSASGHKHL